MQEDKVAELTRSLLESSEYEIKGKKKRPGQEWYMFDNLSTQQSEDLLQQHGGHCYYLVSHFLDPKSYQLTIRFDEREGSVFKHYSISISGRKYILEGSSESFSTIEDVITSVQGKLGLKLIPLFYESNTNSLDLDLSESMDLPPDYTPARKYPEAPRRPLPVIVPIRPTLRRLQVASTRDRVITEARDDVEAGASYENRGLCWKLWHTDTAGKWYKPHKAGPCMALLLIIGWIWFLLLFGWIILLALLLVGILVSCAYMLNFICTGRCSIDDDDDE